MSGVGPSNNRNYTQSTRQTAPAGSASDGQRQQALAEAAYSPAGSVGAAIYPYLNTATGMVGNLCAGRVGDFYTANRALLHSRATPENIASFAAQETQFFRGQSDCSRLMGGFMTANQRAWLLNLSAEYQGR